MSLAPHRRAEAQTALPQSRHLLAAWGSPSTAVLVAVLSFPQAIENIDTLTNLESLFLGKNKITKLQNLDALTNLTVLSMQVRSFLSHPSLRTLAGPALLDTTLVFILHCLHNWHFVALLVSN